MADDLPILRISIENPSKLSDIKLWADLCLQAGMTDGKTAVEANYKRIVASVFTADLVTD